MSHHFDTPTAREDPRINLCDFYLFPGGPSTTVMAMTVNPDAGYSALETLREEGIYAFRFDLDGDAREEVTFKVRFGPVTHAGGDEHRHVQPFELRRATGAAALDGTDGELLVEGWTGEVARSEAGVMAFAGLAPDLFAGDGAALGRFRNAFFMAGRFEPEAFENRKNFFERRNVTAIVVEVPSGLIGHGLVRAWATVSLYGHAPEMQVSRWGLPLITNVFIPDQDAREHYNRGVPADDMTQIAPQIRAVSERLTALAGSAADPHAYADRLIGRLCPTVLPYELGTPAAFDVARFNGRALTDDVMDVILTLATNTALGDGVAPDARRVRPDFPYYGAPYSRAEQIGLTPVHAASKK